MFYSYSLTVSGLKQSLKKVLKNGRLLQSRQNPPYITSFDIESGKAFFQNSKQHTAITNMNLPQAYMTLRYLLELGQGSPKMRVIATREQLDLSPHTNFILSVLSITLHDTFDAFPSPQMETADPV